MTVVGKILVAVNLVFALVVGGLVMMVYLTRTNWEDAYKKSQTAYQAVSADRNAMADAKQAAEAKVAQMQADWNASLVPLAAGDANRLQQLQGMGAPAVLADVIAQRNAAQAKQKRDADQLTQVNSAERKKASEVGSIQTAAVARGEEVKELRASLDKEREEKQAVIKEMNEAKRNATIQLVNARTYKDRAERMEKQVRELATELARSKLGTGGAGGTQVALRRGQENPPPDDVEGRVTYVEAGSDLIKISEGSDAGLAEGHTLKIFRLRPTPEYLGVVEVVNVRAHEAVVRPTSRLRLNPKVGDTVASRIQ